MIADAGHICYHHPVKEGEAMNESNTLGRRIQEGRRAVGFF